MENSEDFFQQDSQYGKKGMHFTEYSQTHPFEYLNQLNNVFQKCNKTVGKDFSSASMVKLPWKKFKPVNIPKCFQENYNLQKKDTYIIRNSQNYDNSEEAVKERKFWKQHQDLMKKYYNNNLINSKSIPNNKFQQRKKHLYSAKSLMNSRSKNTLSASKFTYPLNKTEKDLKNNLNKQNQEYHVALKTQSEQSTPGGFFRSKGSISHTSSTPNLFKQKKGSNNLKKKNCNSKYMNDQIPIEEQVLQKLKKISMIPNFNRAKTTNLLSKQSRGFRQRQTLKMSHKRLGSCESISQNRIKQGEYLEFNMKQELIERYKNKIKDIDCSISEKNVKKTAQILKQMQELYTLNIEDY